VRKFFQSIDHNVLIDKLAGIVRCRPTLALCERIVASSVDDEVPPASFPDDDPETVAARRRGLPIGNLTSQIWGNLYLDRMDHTIKESFRALGYARYTDDFLIWADDKARLHDLRHAIAETLVADRLLLQDKKTRILSCREGVPFLGFRFFPGRAPRLLAEAKRRFEKRSRRQMAAWDGSEETAAAIRASMVGWGAFACYGNIKGLFATYREQGFGSTG
jgi:RNA-directed DNA polymerase